MVYSSRLSKFAVAETDLSAQLKFLYVSADNVLGQVGPAVKVCFGVRQLYQLSVPLTRDQLDRMGSLGPCPSAVVVQASQLPGFSG